MKLRLNNSGYLYGTYQINPDVNLLAFYEDYRCFSSDNIVYVKAAVYRK